MAFCSANTATLGFSASRIHPNMIGAPALRCATHRTDFRRSTSGLLPDVTKRIAFSYLASGARSRLSTSSFSPIMFVKSAARAKKNAEQKKVTDGSQCLFHKRHHNRKARWEIPGGLFFVPTPPIVHGVIQHYPTDVDELSSASFSSDTMRA